MTDTPMTEAEIRQWIDACNHEPAREALRELLAARATINGLRSEKVKPLEWTDNEDGSGSTARVSIFDADCKEEDNPTRYMVTGSCWWLHPSWSAPQAVGLWTGDLAPAKAAAQADYAQRILSALTPIHATTARADGIEVERLRDTLELHQIWLRAALDCKDWAWDGDQRQAAEEAYAQGQAALSTPANEPAKDETEDRNVDNFDGPHEIRNMLP